MDGIFAVAGFTVLGAATIMSGMIHEIAQRYPAILPYENRLATSVLVCFFLLSVFPSFLFSGIFEGMSVRKPLFLKIVFMPRFTLFLIALATFFMIKIGYAYYLVLFYLLLIVWTFFSGMGNVQWLDFVARQIPSDRRGILFGGRDAAGTLIGVIFLSFFPLISRRYPFPDNYGILYSIAAVLLFGSLYFFSRIKEIPYGEKDLQPKISVLQSAVKNINVLKQDREYLNLMLAYFTMNFIFIAGLPLVTLKAIKTLSLSGVEIVKFTSIVTVINAVSFSISCPLAGMIADRWGYKKLSYIALAFYLVFLVLGVSSKSLVLFYVIYAISGFSGEGIGLVSLNFPMEFAPENSRPSYLGIKYLFNVPEIFVPFAGGWIADSYGYEPVFILGAAFAVATLLIFRFLVIDPRSRIIASPSGT